MLLLFAWLAVEPSQTGAALLLVSAVGLVLGVLQAICGAPAPRSS
jgi:hypothetical protein